MSTAPIAPDSTRVDSIEGSEATALAASLVDLGWDKLLAELAKRARSRRGATLCAGIEPLDIDAALARQREIGEARALRDEAQPMPLDGVHDLADALSRSEKGGALEPAALVDIASTLRAGAAVKRHVLKRRAITPGLSGRAVLIDELDELASMLERAFRGGSTEEGGTESGPTGPRLADGASPALASLRRRTRQIREELERALDRLLDASEVAPHLQDRYFTLREDRYVLPIRVEARAKVRGIVHGGSQSGQTVFVEPEALVELNNRKKLADWEVLEEERRILMELSAEVEAQMPAIQVNLEVLAHLDLVDACARLAIDLRAAPPELVDRNGELDLRRARHPLMELSGKRCEPNDLIVGGGQALVLSGPNAGGKTVALKIAGLLSWMARAGLHVPAQEGSRVPMFEVVRCDVGDAQSIERDLSTFSAHVQSLRAYLAVARPGALILLDEIAGGTDPGEGASLAQAVLEALVERGATVIATTHYDRLRLLPTSDARFKNASVGYDLERLQPTFTLTLGIPGASAALSVARRLGLDAAICDRAGLLSGEGPRGLEKLLQDLESERRRLQTAREKAEAELGEAEHARAIAEERAEAAREALLEARRGAHDEAVATLREARAELDRQTTVLRRRKIAPDESALAADRRALQAEAQKVHAQTPAPSLPPGRPATLADLEPGRAVYVARIGGRATVLSRSRGGKVLVQAGALKISVEPSEIHILDAPPPAPSLRSARGHNAFDLSTSAVEERRRGLRTLDVRGERVDVAIGLTEKFLDDALRTGDEEVLLIHGHGTGALRDALRKELRHFPGVAAVTPASKENGGDGATVLRLTL
jgi:DNA mismatch repair protein MutS2